MKSSRCFEDPPVGVGLALGADLHAVGTSHSNFKLKPNAILTMPLGTPILTFGPNAKYPNGVGNHALAASRRYLAACPRRHLLVRRHPLRAVCPGPDRDVAAAANAGRNLPRRGQTGQRDFRDVGGHHDSVGHCPGYLAGPRPEHWLPAR